MKKIDLTIILCLAACLICFGGCSKSEVEPEKIRDVFEALDIKSSDIKLSDTIYSQMADSWEKWKETDPEKRALSSDRPGNKTEYFESWDEAINYIGIDPWNPLEKADWLEKKNYCGTDAKNYFSDKLFHCCFHASGTYDEDIAFSFLDAGYAMGDIQIVITDYIYTINFLDISPDHYSMIKYYQFYKENGNAMAVESVNSDFGYTCMVGVDSTQQDVGISIKLYKDGELKYEIRMVSSGDIENLEILKEAFNKVCTELSIPLEYDVVFK
ncbi:MAG: hypothetical protein IJL20_00100 [Lachnospiraceae bacterium]|nr:hypothetical protein [Lachnospiraceae bacterium]